MEKLETEIEQSKLLNLKSCPNCGVRRPKRYHRSSQTTRSKPTTTIITPNRQNQGTCFVQPADVAKFVPDLSVDYKDEDIEDRLDKLTAKVDKVSSKTHGMLHRSFQLQNSSELLRNQVDRMQDKY